MNESDLMLIFNEVPVARLADVYFAENTWYGTFHLLPGVTNTETGNRIAEYSAFCDDWNSRYDENAADPDEFDAFSDILKEGRWYAVTEDGTSRIPIDKAPYFMGEGEVSFRPKE